MEIKFIENEKIVNTINVNPEENQSTFKKQIKKSEVYNSLPENIKETISTRDFFISANLAQHHGNNAYAYFKHLLPNNAKKELHNDENFSDLPVEYQKAIDGYVTDCTKYAHNAFRPDLYPNPKVPSLIINLDPESEADNTADNIAFDNDSLER